MPSRPSPRHLVPGLLAGLVACLTALPCGRVLAAPTVQEALAVEPRQKGVDYDRPTPEQAAAATIKQEKLDGVSALVVRGGDGRILRAFADANGDRVVDRWSFFKDGLEVYREMDGDDQDAKADQSRWLGSAGTRWGVDTDGDGALDAWKTISAEEATAEIVRALAERDAAAFARLLPTKADLEAAGFSGDRLAAVTARAAAAAQEFAKLAASQKKVGPSATWTSMLTPQPPGVLPAGSPGIDRDVIAYDNVVALADDGGNGVQVIVGSLVRCGDTWRPIDAPQLPGADGRLAETPGFFSPAVEAVVNGAPAAAADETLRPLLAALREIEDRMASADDAGRRTLAGQYVAKLEEVVAAAGAAEKPFWSRQLVETVAAYVQEGLLADGMTVLEKLAETSKDDPELAAFIDFRLIQARYAASMEAADADPEKLQDTWFESLAKFVEDHPKATEAAEALLQLAFRDEFEGRDAEAIARYGELAASFPETPQARKAAGAVRRLESVGKPLGLSGKTLDGKQLAVESLKGRPVLVHFWSTDCEPCKVDMAQIRELQAKYGPQKFACVGVALDGDRQKLGKFLAEKPLPWPQLHEDGGLDSRLAEEYGVLALPTMILVAADGTVADRNVSITDLEKKLAALLGAK
ncbi:MAG: redoxin family protein [Planctomycetota bacterium]